ncbi:MAG: hypothetical protein KKH28_14695, partial [Elusimicrobia bacterium]|nr:hypothetical protein [Elusimicrobiota bacterium]
MSLYSVLHKDPGHCAQKTAEFLAGELGLSKNDAASAYRRRPGFLLESAELEKASAFNLRASAYGFETVLINDNDLASPPPAAPVTKIEPAAAGLYYFTAAAKARLPVENIRLLAMHGADVELAPNEPLHYEATLFESLRNKYFPFRIPIGKPDDRPQPPPDVRTKDTVFTADLITRGPEPLRLTWTYDAFDYSGLGAKKTYSSLENLRLLLGEISAFAFKAGKNGLLSAFLRKEQLAPLKHPSPAAYEKELKWLLTVGCRV